MVVPSSQVGLSGDQGSPGSQAGRSPGRPARVGQALSGPGLPSGARGWRVGVAIHWGSCVVHTRTVRTRRSQMANSCYRPQFGSSRQCPHRPRRGVLAIRPFSLTDDGGIRNA